MLFLSPVPGNRGKQQTGLSSMFTSLGLFHALDGKCQHGHTPRLLPKHLRKRIKAQGL